MRKVFSSRIDRWGVSASKVSKAGASGDKPAFSERMIPGGRVMHELDRSVHERALQAAGRKLRALQKAQ